MRFAYRLLVDRHAFQARDDKANFKQPLRSVRLARLRLGPRLASLRLFLSLGPSSFRPLLLLLETNPEAKGDVADARGVDEAPGGTQGRPVAAPGTTACDPGRARCGTWWVSHWSNQVSPIPIVRPFHNIPMHIVKAPRVRRVLPNIAGLTSALFVVRIVGSDGISP